MLEHQNRALNRSVLIVEDDHDSAEALSRLVKRQGIDVARAHSLREARAMIALRQPHLVLLDLMLPDGSGMELCDDADLLASAQIVLITGRASLETSIRALRAGVADYLVKPIGSLQLDAILARVSTQTAVAGASAASALSTLSGRFGALVGSSAAMRAVYADIGKVANTAAVVLIEGRTGTGKELAAQTIHALSRRREGPFVALNCGAISPTLVETELFGHEKGSFTGAERLHRGVFEQARGGTLFLDEVTEMPLALQTKLLRVLESGTFMRVGGSQLQRVDVRIVAATNRDPRQAVADGVLREDLYYRLNVFTVCMPSLSERRSDIDALARHFADQISQIEGVQRRLSKTALEALAQREWPGNVRELRNAVYRAYVVADGDTIEAADFAQAPIEGSATDAQPYAYLGDSLAQAERRLIIATLSHLQQNRQLAAEQLGISVKTLYNKMREYRQLAEESPLTGSRPKRKLLSTPLDRRSAASSTEAE